MDKLRSYRFHNTALFDYLSTIAGAFALTSISNIPLVLATVILFVAGEISHAIFKVETQTNKYLKQSNE